MVILYVKTLVLPLGVTLSTFARAFSNFFGRNYTIA